jgi:hypothetical protein
MPDMAPLKLRHSSGDARVKPGHDALSQGQS